MLFNVPESEKEDPEGKKKDDLEFLRVLMSEIKLTVPFFQVIRIGVAEKTRDAPRPMRARNTCITDQRKILKAASILKDTGDYTHTYLLINLKDTFFDTAVGPRQIFLHACADRDENGSHIKQIDPPNPILIETRSYRRPSGRRLQAVRRCGQIS